MNIKILKEIFDERKRQEKKWGEQNHNPYKWMTILVEEVGEAGEAVLEADASNNSYDISMWLDKYRRELIQVAAVAVAAVESLDRNAKR